MIKKEEIIDVIARDFKGKQGILCLTCVILKSSLDEIQGFMNSNEIKMEKKSFTTKFDYLKQIFYDLYVNFNHNSQIQSQYSHHRKILHQ